MLVTRSVRPPEHALNVSKYSKGTALSPRAPFMDVCRVRIVENEQLLMYFLTVVHFHYSIEGASVDKAVSLEYLLLFKACSGGLTDSVTSAVLNEEVSF